MLERKETAPTEKAIVYVKDGITYVPHYRDRTLFVGPGYPIGNGDPLPEHTYTAIELESAGAKAEVMLLWPRPHLARAPIQ